jgi:2-oxoglutarate dehydrogenase E1 component
MWVDQENAQKYFPLSHLSNSQASFDAFNSPLSEFAVLGFEFGYSATHPKALVIWEAQYGDFANGAQVIIDQYIASSEQKWMQNSNLTLMLPHAYEGQGPEHSSARLERFLQLCADENMFVVNYTTPAQLFHVLRRQAKREIKKPLILFTPKMLLRHAPSFSSMNDFSQGCFEEILDDPTPAKNTKKLLLCSGKIYYDLVAERTRRGKDDTTIIRIEQLYPLHEQKLKSFLLKYEGFEQCYWVQEEHSNAGAGEYIHPILNTLLGGGPGKIRYAGRARSASTAAGSFALHKKQYAVLMDEVFQ